MGEGYVGEAAASDDVAGGAKPESRQGSRVKGGCEATWVVGGITPVTEDLSLRYLDDITVDAGY